MRAFPEWHNMDKALEDIIKSNTKEVSEFNITQGQPFSDFARKQSNEDVAEILFKIDEQLKNLMEQTKQTYSAVPKVRSELNKLRTLNEDIKNKKKNRDAIKARSEKSSKAADRAETKLETLRIRNPSSPEFNKAQDEYDQWIRQKQADITALEEREATLVTEVKEYKKELFRTIVNALITYVGAKEEVCSSSASIGDQISDLGAQIPPYDDPTIETLQTQLQAYRSEPLE